MAHQARRALEVEQRAKAEARAAAQRALEAAWQVKARARAEALAAEAEEKAHPGRAAKIAKIAEAHRAAKIAADEAERLAKVARRVLWVDIENTAYACGSDMPRVERAALAAREAKTRAEDARLYAELLGESAPAAVGKRDAPPGGPQTRASMPIAAVKATLPPALVVFDD
jgi:hypothetical protein